jgi:hypothetical protein
VIRFTYADITPRVTYLHHKYHIAKRCLCLDELQLFIGGHLGAEVLDFKMNTFDLEGRISGKLRIRRDHTNLGVNKGFSSHLLLCVELLLTPSVKVYLALDTLQLVVNSSA